MPRAIARKKSGTKSQRRGGSKGGHKPSKPKAPSRKPAAVTNKRPAKGRTRAAERPRKKSAPTRGRRAPRKEPSVMQPPPRKRVSPFAPPTPAPEKPPRLLTETKQTAGALALLEKSIKLIYQKEFKKARHELESIAAQYPREAEINARARSYLQICDREETAHKKPTVTHDQLYTLGVMEHNRGNYDGAIAYFHQSLEKHGNADHIFYSLAASQAQKNDVSPAIDNLRKAIELNEENRIYAKNDHDFTPLHQERAFIELVGAGSNEST